MKTSWNGGGGGRKEARPRPPEPESQSTIAESRLSPRATGGREIDESKGRDAASMQRSAGDIHGERRPRRPPGELCVNRHFFIRKVGPQGHAGVMHRPAFPAGRFGRH
ncbi:hypothetical protein AAFF_G00158740 [Aldrovandia affinis]|uniref:Uncharacterized protein n=1 Tax=Aldrovandia affinis TaxID=143900 RepID=A0AAD7W7N0_9TELE|nr:hypothetical protein AAFF_G00158740 [Aldrovandia affinis]